MSVNLALYKADELGFCSQCANTLVKADRLSYIYHRSPRPLLFCETYCMREWLEYCADFEAEKLREYPMYIGAYRN